MDDALDGLVNACVGSLVGIVFALAIGAVVLAGWLIYKFCEAVLPPLVEALAEGCEVAAHHIAAWYREMTWKRRAIRAHNEAIRAIDAARREQVALTRAAIDAIERQQQLLTAGRTAAVRPVDRVAVRVS